MNSIKVLDAKSLEQLNEVYENAYYKEVHKMIQLDKEKGFTLDLIKKKMVVSKKVRVLASIIEKNNKLIEMDGK